VLSYLWVFLFFEGLIVGVWCFFFSFCLIGLIAWTKIAILMFYELGWVGLFFFLKLARIGVLLSCVFLDFYIAVFIFSFALRRIAIDGLEL
jgi:hypothetical protein